MLDWFDNAIRRFMIWAVHCFGGLTPAETELPETFTLQTSVTVDKSFIPQEAEHFLAEKIAGDILQKGLCKFSREERKHVTRYTATVTVVFPGEESVGEETQEQPESPEESDDGTVRCKDCIYYREEDELPHITPFMECARPNPDDPEWHLKYHFKNDNDTCPHGVRRKDG